MALFETAHDLANESCHDHMECSHSFTHNVSKNQFNC